MNKIPVILFSAAAEADSYVGKSLLSTDLTKAFTNGLADVVKTHSEALELVIPTALTIVIASAAANFVLGKIKGVFGWAS